MLRTSRYNFVIPLEDGDLIYSARSGAVLRLQGCDGRRLAAILGGRPQSFSAAGMDRSVVDHLRRSDFIIESDRDELAEMRHRYWEARRDAPLVFTVTTTMDCNLGCYYCYETRSSDQLRSADIPALTAHVARKLEETGKKSVHVDWYGGEPLLNVGFLETASAALQALCGERQVRYAASVVSNGTCWPADVENFVARHRIRQVQVSFDGLRENHNRRRRYRARGTASRSSFDEIVALVSRLLRVVRVDLRINIDRGNQADVVPLLGFMEEQGWFGQPFPATVQPARLASYSDRSAFMREHELSVSEYDVIRRIVRDVLRNRVRVEESEAPDGFPWPRRSVCAALAHGSDVVGADGFLYRCGLQVGEQNRRVGSLRSPSDELLPILGHAEPDAGHDQEFWETFDPTRQPTCSRCSFLPICWGGCPKKYLEGDRYALAEQGEYWRRNLARLVTSHLGLRTNEEVVFTESDQFRD